MRAPPVAESSELSEWLRSIKSRIGESPKILSGTATGHGIFAFGDAPGWLSVARQEGLVCIFATRK